MPPIEIDRGAHAVFERCGRLPAREAPDLRDVAVEVAGLLRPALGCELGVHDLRTGNGPNNGLRQLAERAGRVATDVQSLAVTAWRHRAAQHGAHAIVHVEEV